jgi:hypothetical protein
MHIYHIITCNKKVTYKDFDYANFTSPMHAYIEKFFYQNEPDDEDFIGNMIAGFSEGNLCHIRSRKIRNTIQVRKSINMLNDPGRKAPAVFPEA